MMMALTLGKDKQFR